MFVVFSWWSQSAPAVKTNEVHYVFTKDSKVFLKSDDFQGAFEAVKGRASINDSLRVMGFDMIIDVNSLVLNMEGMAKHAKSSDFFDAVNFPAITFFGKEIVANDSVWTVSGSMKSKGIEIFKTIPFSYEFSKKGVLFVEANFPLKRSDFSIGEPEAVSDEVLIHTVLFAKKN